MRSNIIKRARAFQSSGFPELDLRILSSQLRSDKDLRKWGQHINVFQFGDLKEYRTSFVLKRIFEKSFKISKKFFCWNKFFQSNFIFYFELKICFIFLQEKEISHFLTPHGAARNVRSNNSPNSKSILRLELQDTQLCDGIWFLLSEIKLNKRQVSLCSKPRR